MRSMRPVTTRTRKGPLMLGWCEKEVFWSSNSLGDRSHKLSRLRIRRDTVQQRNTSYGHCNQESKIAFHTDASILQGNGHDTKKTLLRKRSVTKEQSGQ